MTERRGHAGFSDISPLRRNRDRLPGSTGILRLIFIVCAMFAAAQWIVPIGVRLAFNGGRLYPSDEPFSLWDPVVPFPVMSVPAWLTILTCLVGLTAATTYLIVRGDQAGEDAVYVSMLSLAFFGFFPWGIAALDIDPTGVISTPDPDGYPIGWHWVLTPFAPVLLALGIVSTVRYNRALDRRKAEARRRMAARD